MSARRPAVMQLACQDGALHSCKNGLSNVILLETPPGSPVSEHQKAPKRT